MLGGILHVGRILNHPGYTEAVLGVSSGLITSGAIGWQELRAISHDYPFLIRYLALLAFVNTIPNHFLSFLVP